MSDAELISKFDDFGCGFAWESRKCAKTKKLNLSQNRSAFAKCVSESF